MDDDFEGPSGFFAPDVVVPLTTRQTLGLPEGLGGRSLRWLNVVARPKPGSTPAAIAGDILPIVREELTEGRARDWLPAIRAASVDPIVALRAD